MGKVIINKTGKTYYIATTGNNSNDGLTTGTAWATLTYALSIASPLMPGDTVYVKAGSYGNESIIGQKNGMPGAPINIIGYKTTPGDQPAMAVDSLTPYAALSSTEMPTYTGASRTTGTCFYLQDSSYLSFRNIQVQNYEAAYFIGVSYTVADTLTRESHVSFFNCVAKDLGGAGYTGRGFAIGVIGDYFANRNRVEKCMVVNAYAEGITLCGNYNVINGCKIYHNDGANLMDYYIFVCGSYNVIDGCYAEKDPLIGSGGHGIGIKSNAEQVVDQGLNRPVVAPMYNRVINCTVMNVDQGFYVRHRLVKYNTFYKCYAKGTHLGTTVDDGDCKAYVIRDGASYNIFDSCFAESAQAAVCFRDTVEDGDTGGTPPGHPGNYNKVVNCVFYNCYAAMSFDTFSIPSDAGINEIANCTFYLCRYLHVCNRDCANMIYTNNIYYGNSALGFGGYFRGGPFQTSVTSAQFTYCTFYNIPSMPGGFAAASVGSVTTDPLFVSLGVINVTAPDMHLQASSPIRNSGTALPWFKRDYDGINRPFSSAYSMGAYER